MLVCGTARVGAGPDWGLVEKTGGRASIISQITPPIINITPKLISRIGPMGIGFTDLIIRFAGKPFGKNYLNLSYFIRKVTLQP